MCSTAAPAGVPQAACRAAAADAHAGWTGCKRNNDGVTGESEQFVGRARELAELAAVVRDGRGGVVLVAGEAGIGKSRLVAEAVRDARSAVVWGTCWDGDGAPPFWPWVPVIRACLASEAGRVWRERPDPSVAEVMALLPEEGGSTPAADASRFRLFEGVTRALRVAGGADGLIVVLDDLQWGDEASVRLLGFAARGLLDEPVVIVGTYRDDEVGPDHALAAVSAELAGRLRHLELSGLDADELAAFVRSQRDGDGALAAEQVADLHRVTGGNPFFAREVLALVGGERSRASMRVPAGVRAVIERRLARLSHVCDDALKVAAVIGTSFSLEVVARAMGIAVADVLGVLGEALEAGVVVVEDAFPVICGSLTICCGRRSMSRFLRLFGPALMHRLRRHWSNDAVGSGRRRRRLPII